MTKLVDVLASELKAWPNLEYFTCDPSGEIRGRDSIEHDFYPKEKVDESDMTKDYASLGDDLPRVTKEQWQEARNKLKEKQVNKDGWTPHRGGKCPVQKGTLVDVRYRNGVIVSGAPALEAVPGDDATYTYWRQENHEKDIMAYRLHKPEVKEPEAKQELAVKFDPIALRDAIHQKELNIAGSLEAVEQWRSEVQCMKDKLKVEGFELVDIAKAEDIDFSDPNKWKKGDVIIAIDACEGQFSIGTYYSLREDCNEDYVRVCSDDKGYENGWAASCFKFSHRP